MKAKVESEVDEAARREALAEGARAIDGVSRVVNLLHASGDRAPERA